MPKRGAQPLQGEVLQGTLDLLVLQTLLLGPAHEACRRHLAGEDVDLPALRELLPDLAWRVLN